jgi:GWxTD domain-containing protein
VGGPLGFTVDATSYPDSTGHTLDVFLRIPPSTLANLGRDPDGVAHVLVTARLRGSGLPARTAEQQLSIAPTDSSGGFGKVLLLRFPVRPGGHRMEVRIEDRQTRKRGLLAQMRKELASAKVDGALAVPPPQNGRDLSDIEFVWSQHERDVPDAFTRAGVQRLPNPERLFGLYATDLSIAFVARAPGAEPRAWRWIARLFDARGQLVGERDGTGPVDRRLDAATSLDVSTLPAGGYEIEVKAFQEGDSGAAVRRARCSVGWQVDTWLRNPRDVRDDVHFLLMSEGEEAFARMHPGEQERFLEDFWRERDPTPETAENEARTTFLSRVDFANRTYGRFGIGRGMFSDMGRTFVRYGEPSEVLRQVIPAGDETLARAIYELSLAEDRPLGDVHQKGLGGDIRPYEVWIYEGEIPLPPDADPRLKENARRKRLVFLFVDEQGLGDYRLRYTTE